ncbi:outer membrane protein assembly factor BamB family protein [Streptomyces omiyaensis]|uniref:outer membrane protein assembly factor BamB family protein n=1 Tax=Streptomyces omiyaensis TaxID=68247 RepID=UPI00167A1B2D|nr:PQQ-binding-like beta-propeller repeat protein [Streptomyces omiyaensis]
MERHEGRGVSRRTVLRRTGTGAGLAALGAGAWGCGPVEEPGAAAPSAPSGTPSGAPAGGGEAFATPPPGTAPEPLWQRRTAGGALGMDALAVAGDVVLVSNDPLIGRSATTGAELWRRAEAAVPGARMLVRGGTLYLASARYDGDVVGLDPATGRETWRSRLGKRFAQPRPIAADEHRVYVLAGVLGKDFRVERNVVAAIDASTGKVAWQELRDAGTQEYGIAADAAGRYLVYTDYEENVTVRSTDTGRQLWTKKIGRSNSGRLAVHDGLVIVADAGRLRAFALADGAEKWSLASEEFTRFHGIGVLDGVLYAADSGHVVRAVDPATGRESWRTEALLDVAYPGQFAKVGTTLYAATELDDKGGILAFDARSGKLRWRYNDGSEALDQWYVAAAGTRLMALHGKRLTALPAV